MAAKRVQTVTGPIPASSLGRTLVHEHVRVATRAGISTPGRRSSNAPRRCPGAWTRCRPSRATASEPPWIRGDTGSRVVSPYERKLVTAAARAAKATGVPIISHTQDASCGHDQIDLVTGEGVPSNRLLVGHSDGTEDHRYQRSLAERGSFVGFDRFGIKLFQSDEVRVRNVIKLAQAGHTERILISHDSVVCWLGRPYPFAPSWEAMLELLPDWRSTHILRKIIPQLLEGGLSKDDIETILVENPRRFFAGA